MDETQRQACLGELLANWKALGEEFRPPSVWIAEHGPVSLANASDDSSYASPVVTAWRLNDHGLARRDPQEYVRFMTVQTGVHWAWGTPPRGIFHNTGRHPIALAGFAPIAATDLIALHYIWGGLFGRG